jgi:hypothetical protein
MSTGQIVYICVASFICLAAMIGFIQTTFMYTCSVCKVSKFGKQMYQITPLEFHPASEDQEFKCTCNKCAKAIDKKLKASLNKGR